MKAIVKQGSQPLDFNHIFVAWYEPNLWGEHIILFHSLILSQILHGCISCTKIPYVWDFPNLQNQSWKVIQQENTCIVKWPQCKILECKKSMLCST
jgi:hypothetical protein